jgi:hypothetical protein
MLTRCFALVVVAAWMGSDVEAMTWSGDPGWYGPGPMDGVVATWNTYATYGYNIPVYYNSGIPTAQSDYMGSIGFGGQGNYRAAMHESSHWMGTGTVSQWGLHQRYSIWNGTYAANLRRAYDGPGERQFIYGVHYGPQGANYDSEGVQGPQMVGIIGAFRHDMELSGGDQTIGIASGTYRLRQRVAVKTLDSRNAAVEGAQVRQGETEGGNNSQLWNVALVEGTPYFTLQNVATGKYLDSMGATTNGAPVGMTSLSGAATDNQLWQIVQTDSFYFKIVNKANGRALDNLGATGDGAGVAQWDAAGNFSWNQHWTFLHSLAQTAPPAGVVSQGRPVTSSSTEGGNYDNKGNNGVSGDRWTAADGSYPQWWRVDTGTVQPITRVEIDWFKDGAPTFRYRIEVSNDDSTWTLAADRTGNAVSGTTVDELVGVTGRFVRVTVTGVASGGYYAAFYECRVYNETTPLKNVSQFRPATATSEQAGNLAVNANDVDPVFTRWCANSPDYPASWQVDLGSAQSVRRAVIAWFDDDGRSYKYKVEGSTDGVNFTTLADRTNNTTPYTTSDDFTGTARYVRITVTGGSAGYPSFYDAQIYAAASSPVPGPAVLTTSLKMDEASGATAFDDSGNGRDGTLVNGPARTAGRLDGGLSFDGSNDQVTLPAGVVSGLTDCTISAWVKAGSLATWGRVFDFGTGTNNYLFLTLNAPTGRPRVAIRVPDSGEQVIDSSIAFPLNVWTHVALTIAGDNATLYINGIAVGGNGTMTLNPARLGNTTQNYLGRSQFAGDPYFGGFMDEFQIRDRALSASEVAALAAPPSAPTGTVATSGNGRVTLAWNAVSGATGYNVKRAITSGGPYTTVASGVTATHYADTATPLDTPAYYVVTASKLVAESAKSAQVSGQARSASAWRQLYFGTTENTGDAADTADPDGDGSINGNEFAANTVPTDPTSFLKINDPQISGHDIVLGFPSVAGQTYRVEYSATLAAASWMTLGSIGSEIVGTGNPISIVDAGAALQSRRFYRLVAVP